MPELQLATKMILSMWPYHTSLCNVFFSDKELVLFMFMQPRLSPLME
jgi:hypothetical protein